MLRTLILLTTGTALALYALAHFVSPLLAERLIDASSMARFDSTSSLHTMVILVAFGVVLIVAATLVARSTKLRGWRVALTAVVATVASVAVAVGADWLLSFWSVTEESGLSSAPVSIALAIVWSVALVFVSWLVASVLARSAVR